MAEIPPPAAQSAWLACDTTPEALASSLVPHFAEGMRLYPVSTRVNTPKNQDSQLIESAGTL